MQEEEILEKLGLVEQMNFDSFSSGQIGSKLWLCEELEKLYDLIDEIWIYGGWYGVTAFLLQTRNNIKIKKIRSFDIDPDCESIADKINENWKWQEWKFKAVTADCNSPSITPVGVDLVINTSCEHFESFDWFFNIPKGTKVVLQGADMLHDDHIVKFTSLEDFCKYFPLSEINFKGEKIFNYPSWSFKRFMIIGEK